MEEDLTNQPSQREAEKIQYTLRSTFFYRRRLVYKQLVAEVDMIDSSQYDWSMLSELGISRSSWDSIKNKNIPPARIFCHPDLIIAEPRLITYYRSAAILPQKGVQRLIFGVKSLEESRGQKLAKGRAILLAKTLNRHISLIIDADPNFSLEDIRLAGLMNFGAQINGSWRNEIGLEGSRRVKELILKHFLDKNLIANIMAKDGSLLPISAALKSMDEIREFVVSNNYKVAFGSEPDISIISPGNILEVAIEVKAGIDPAGAMERYGAAKKSFDKALRENKSAITIFLASCITEGVQDAITTDRLVTRDFNLTNIFTDDNVKEDFLQYVRWLMHL